MTDSEAETIRAIEVARKKREDDLLLALLLMFADATDEAEANPAIAVNIFHSALLTSGVPLIANAMAEVHLDGYSLHASDEATVAAESSADDLVRKYTPSATTMAQAMADTLASKLYEAASPKREESSEPIRHTDTSKLTGEQVESALQKAGYSHDQPNGIKLGVERNIVIASNMGAVDAALSESSGSGGKKPKQVAGTVAIALRHRSVLDASTTDICEERDGLTLAVDDPYWQLNWPSLHWLCRSVVLVVRNVVLSTSYPAIPPAEGFGMMPFQL